MHNEAAGVFYYYGYMATWYLRSQRRWDGHGILRLWFRPKKTKNKQTNKNNNFFFK